MDTVVCFMPPAMSHLHIGSARTALLGWLFAKSNNGKFLINFSMEADNNESPQIFNCLNWLGLFNDCGPYYQYQHICQYEKAISILLDKGMAYIDCSRKSEYRWEKEASLKAGKPFRYSRKYIIDTEFKRQSYEFHRRPQTIRLKMPQEGSISVYNILGDNVKKDVAICRDIVLKKPDGSFTYEFRQAVDYVIHNVTHVIREEDQKIYTPQQTFICKGLGRRIFFAHIPFITEPDSTRKLNRRKLKKYRIADSHFRTLHDYCASAMEFMNVAIKNHYNPMFIDFYERAGFLPSAIINYLVFLSNTPKSVSHYISLSEMVKQFDLSWLQLGGSFNLKKILQFQRHHMNNMSNDDKYVFYQRFLKNSHNSIDYMASLGSKFRIGSDLVNLQ